jgi:hypothetical protein
MSDLNSAENQFFHGDFQQLSSWLSILRCLPSIGASQTSLIGSQSKKIPVQQPMRVQDPMWNRDLLSIADGQTPNIEDWRTVGQHFGATVTQTVAIAQFFFYFSLSPIVPYSFDSLSSVNSCLEQTHEPSQLQLARVEKLRDSFIGGVCMC